MNGSHAQETRVLILAPTGRDAALAAEVLGRCDIHADIALTPQALCDQIQAGAGAVLLAEEALSPVAMTHLAAALHAQPAWSDLPFIIFAVPTDTTSSMARQQRMLDSLGNVTLIERPFRVATLVTAVRAALRARHRQYAARRTLLELEQQEAALMHADQRKDEFLAMLAHELRNPLAAISMALSLLERTAGDEVRSARYRETARRQMGSLVRLVDDLLDVSRITRGTVELRRTPVDLAQLVRAAVAAARPTLELRQLALALEVSPGQFGLEADATRLEQVIANLLSNAAKYTEPGGRVTVRLSREAVNGQPFAHLAVRDTGRGIPGPMLSKIFDLFVQVDKGLDRSLGGLGLGLTLVKRLIEMHGGTVEARSGGPEQGSEFLVRLPLSTAVAAQAPGRNQVAVAPTPRTVVLVEDSDDARETLKEYLEELGYVVVAAANGVDGVQRLLECRPDVGLVDVGLPQIDGYEVARRVRAHPAGARVYLVALTGYGGEQAVSRAKEAGFDRHLTKPVSADDLPAILEAGRA